MSQDSRPRVAAVAGATILADAALARILLTADAARVYFLGRPLPVACGFRRSTGLPCPTCGLTRSTVLAIHGQLSASWHVMPAGPVLALGVLGIGLVLLWYAAIARWRPPVERAVVHRWMVRAGLAYGGAAVLTWLGGWTMQFLTALHGGPGK